MKTIYRLMGANSVDVLPVRVAKIPSLVNYSYVIANRASGTLVLVDPTWEVAPIEEAIRRSGGDVSAILLTHSHLDHTLLAQFFAEKYNCPVWMSEEEITTYGFTCANLLSFTANQRLPVDGMRVEAFLTPGHTKGSSCYLIEDNFFSGDTIFIEGCGMCWGKGADPEAMYTTLSRLKEWLHSDIRVFPGHSYGLPPGQTFDFLVKNNIYLNINTLEQFVAFRMRDGQKKLFSFV